MNAQQAKRFQKIYTEPIYLLDKEQDDTSEDLVFHISGSTRSVYKTTIYKAPKEGDLGVWCSCMDMRSHARRHNCVCKHICFVVFKALKCVDIGNTEFFNTLRFTESELEAIYTRFAAMTMNGVDYVDAGLVEDYHATADMFAPVKEADPDDICPICFDGFAGTENVGCPTCRNLIHRECAVKWISMGKDTCVFCRSEAWAAFPA